MAEITLTKGHYALVDDDDYADVSAYNWYAFEVRRRGGSIARVYARRNVSAQKTQSLHRFLLGITNPQILVDHKNRNGLDNRRENLRTCTRTQNQGNRRAALSNSSGFKGVYRLGAKWGAQITRAKKGSKLGVFSSPELAAVAYDEAAIKYFGEFAHLNFPKTA